MNTVCFTIRKIRSCYIPEIYLFKLLTAIVSLAWSLYVTMASNIIIKLSKFFSLATTNTLTNKNKTKIADSGVGNALVFKKDKKNPININTPFENYGPDIEIKDDMNKVTLENNLFVIPKMKK